MSSLLPRGWQYERPAHRLRPGSGASFRPRQVPVGSLAAALRANWFTKGVLSRSLAARSVTERHCHTVLTGQARHPSGNNAEYTPLQAFPRRRYITGKRHRSLFNPVGFACSLCLPYYRHGKCSGGVGGLPPGARLCFVWRREIFGSAFGPMGQILGQQAAQKPNFGPNFSKWQK